MPTISLHSVPTFASFLKEVESPYEVHDYVRAYLGDTPEAKDFAKQFLERRAKQNANQQKPAQQNQQQALKQQQVRGAEVEPAVPSLQQPHEACYVTRWEDYLSLCVAQK